MGNHNFHLVPKTNINYRPNEIAEELLRHRKSRLTDHGQTRSNVERAHYGNMILYLFQSHKFLSNEEFDMAVKIKYQSKFNLINQL